MLDGKVLRLISWYEGKKMPPLTLDINPTDRCNLRCLSCWQRSEKFKNIDSSYELPDDKLISVVKEAIKFGVEEFEITGGGEPMMRKKTTMSIMRLVKKEEKFGNITTNGTLFMKEDVEELVKIGWDRVTFSLDAPDEKTNDYLRGKGTFEKVMESIHRFNELKSSSKSEKPILKFNVVVSKKNYEKLAGMIELARELRVDIVSFEPLTVHSSIGERLSLEEKEARKLKESVLKIDELARSYGILTNIVNFSNERLVVKPKHLEVLKENESTSSSFASCVCFEPWWHLVIKVDGSAQPCCLFDSKEENVRCKSLKKIWYGKHFEGIRKSMLEGRFSEFCERCNAGQVAENMKIKEKLSELMDDVR